MEKLKNETITKEETKLHEFLQTKDSNYLFRYKDLYLFKVKTSIESKTNGTIVYYPIFAKNYYTKMCLDDSNDFLLIGFQLKNDSNTYLFSNYITNYSFEDYKKQYNDLVNYEDVQEKIYNRVIDKIDTMIKENFDSYVKSFEKILKENDVDILETYQEQFKNQAIKNFIVNNNDLEKNINIEINHLVDYPNKIIESIDVLNYLDCKNLYIENVEDTTTLAINDIVKDILNNNRTRNSMIYLETNKQGQARIERTFIIYLYEKCWKKQQYINEYNKLLNDEKNGTLDNKIALYKKMYLSIKDLDVEKIKNLKLEFYSLNDFVVTYPLKDLKRNLQNNYDKIWRYHCKESDSTIEHLNIKYGLSKWNDLQIKDISKISYRNNVYFINEEANYLK